MTASLNSLSDHVCRDPQKTFVAEALNSPPTRNGPTPTSSASAGTQAPDSALSPPLTRVAAPSQGPTPPAAAKAPTAPTAGSPLLEDFNVPTPAMLPAVPKDQTPGAGPSDRPATAMDTAISRVDAPWLADPILALAADVVDDLEDVRKSNENRLRQLTRNEEDSDGEERGFGLTLNHLDVARLASLVEELSKAEHRAVLNLNRQLRQHPLGPWVKAQRGVGEKTGARLLAAVGDPYWNTLYDRPRTVSELWAYCGYKPGQRRRRGEKDNWSATAKMRAFLVAEACTKQLVAPCAVVKGEKGEYLAAEHVDDCGCSPYRVVYDEGRARYAGTVHPEDCARCGPAGKPALAGSLRSAKHQHQMAVRLATKAMLRDLWREAKRLHEERL